MCYQLCYMSYVLSEVHHMYQTDLHNTTALQDANTLKAWWELLSLISPVQKLFVNTTVWE